MAASMTATFPAGHSSTNGIRVAQENRTHDKVPQVAVDDTLLTVDDLVRRRARTVGQEIIVSYPSKGIDYVDYTMQQLDVFAYRVARHYEDKLPVRSSSDDKPMVVGILGPSNLEYLITILALMKLGHTTLFLSTRISQEAVDSLLKATGAKALLVDTRYSGAANSAVKPLPRLQCIEIAPRLVFEFPVDTHIDTRLDGGLDHEIETSNNVYIIHSSGQYLAPSSVVMW
jgi:acyl-CoA synthetase (AMP-forming)/AMP-acid ligase II